MPFTPYHFGPSGFIGLALRKYIDVPVFVLANVIVDIEVLVLNLLQTGWPIHRYAHTLLLGAAAGVICAVAAYPLRHFFKKIMQIIRLPYQANLRKMVISGVLGVWLHVAIDAIYHWDVPLLWPGSARPLWHLVSQGQLKAICIAFLVAAAVLYVIIVVPHSKQNRAKKSIRESNERQTRDAPSTCR
ncbi:MAG: hypothetical protein JSV99_08470 [Planctomycetota bacterium]|nr:MAG: hypothetical protein JSV99_08470 [Planctomycetota bacterium]